MKKQYFGFFLTLFLSFFSLDAFAKNNQVEELKLVNELYKYFSVKPDPKEERNIATQNKAVLLNYFDPELTRLLLKDQACSFKSDGVCNLDFDPIYHSQDNDGCKVKVINDSGIFALINCGNYHEKIIYKFSKINGFYKIKDIIYKDKTSLKELLK